MVQSVMVRQSKPAWRNRALICKDFRQPSRTANAKDVEQHKWRRLFFKSVETRFKNCRVTMKRIAGHGANAAGLAALHESPSFAEAHRDVLHLFPEPSCDIVGRAAVSWSFIVLQVTMRQRKKSV